uniref:Uncharacterized protein n=1 Tax=Anopheles coluzzii TaxID=1518534 RepID=A0A8W7P0L1_ANOCL
MYCYYYYYCCRPLGSVGTHGAYNCCYYRLTPCLGRKQQPVSGTTQKQAAEWHYSALPAYGDEIRKFFRACVFCLLAWLSMECSSYNSSILYRRPPTLFSAGASTGNDQHLQSACNLKFLRAKNGSVFADDNLENGQPLIGD